MKIINSCWELGLDNGIIMGQNPKPDLVKVSLSSPCFYKMSHAITAAVTNGDFSFDSDEEYLLSWAIEAEDENHESEPRFFASNPPDLYEVKPRQLVEIDDHKIVYFDFKYKDVFVRGLWAVVL